MSLPSWSLILAILLSVVYGTLAIAARAHVDKGKATRMSPALLAMTVWWPFYDIYDEGGRKLRVCGVVLLPIIAAAYIYWGMNS